MEEVSENLKILRKAKDLTMIEVSEATGLSQGYLSRLESEKIKEPSIQVVIKLAKLFKVSLDDFCTKKFAMEIMVSKI